MRRLLVLALLALAAMTALADDAELDRLRVDYATHFFTAEAHLRLAKYLADHGRGLTGFHISEEARLQHFSEEEFARAVRRVYREEPFDDSLAAEAALCAEIVTNPSPSAETIRKLAAIHLWRGEWPQAEELLRHAMAADPESYAPVTALAGMLRRMGREAEGDQLELDWLNAHPESLETWRVRAARVVEQDVESATATIAEAITRYPRDPEIVFHKAGLLHDQKKLMEASVEYERAAALAPQSAHIQAWTARFFLKALNDGDQALRYYVRAYFLDPEAQEVEAVAERVRTLAEERAVEYVGLHRKAIETTAVLLRNPDPFVVAIALERARANWTRWYTEPVVALLEHDSPALRYPAAAVLATVHSRNGDRWLRDMVAGKMTDPTDTPFGFLVREGRSPGLDLYVRSATAYTAGARFRFRLVKTFEPWLASPIDLLRFDAISVMAEFGGAQGRNRLRKLHRSGGVRDARIKAILDERFGKRVKSEEEE